MLALWLLDGRALAFLQTDLRVLVPLRLIRYAWSLSFGVLGDPGAILGRFWDIGEQEVQDSISSIFGSDFD